MRRTAALIAGGGPAGSAAAIRLAAGGARPLVLERSRTPADPLCGGFLSWRTLASLRAFGLDPGALGGEPVGRLRLFAGARHASALLPAPGLGLSRRTLDAALLARAAAAGAGVERGVAIRAVEPEGSLRLEDGSRLCSEALFLATGKHELRGLARPRAAAGADPALGLRLRLGPTPALARLLGGTIELHLFRGGYAGLLLQEDGSANLCMALRRSRLAEAGNDPAALIAAVAREAPALGERVAASRSTSAIEAVAHVPYGWRARKGGPGLFRLGDQAGVTPSLAGEGIGIALASGAAAAEAWLAGGPAAGAAFQARFGRQLRRPIGIASALLALAERPSLARPLLGLVAQLPGLLDPLARLTRVAEPALTTGLPPPISAA